MPCSQPASSSRASSVPRGCPAMMTASFSTVGSDTANRGITGSGPGICRRWARRWLVAVFHCSLHAFLPGAFHHLGHVGLRPPLGQRRLRLLSSARARLASAGQERHRAPATCSWTGCRWRRPRSQGARPSPAMATASACFRPARHKPTAGRPSRNQAGLPWPLRHRAPMPPSAAEAHRQAATRGAVAVRIEETGDLVLAKLV